MQRQQRAKRRRGQAGQDRDRMDEALIENAEHDVDDDDRRREQQALALQRLLEDLGVALVAAAYRDRELDIALELRDLVDSRAERVARLEVEGDRDRGSWP